MTEPRRVRTQAERAGDDHTWRQSIGEVQWRGSECPPYCPGHTDTPVDQMRTVVTTVLREHLPAIGEALAEIARPLRRRWWHRLTRRNP